MFDFITVQKFLNENNGVLFSSIKLENKLDTERIWMFRVIKGMMRWILLDIANGKVSCNHVVCW